jgi:hypothetical protein
MNTFIRCGVSWKLTPWSWVLLEKPPFARLLKNFQAFYGPRMFITVFTRAFHWSLSWAGWIQFIPRHSISLWFILILSSYPLLGLHSCLFPFGFPTKNPIRMSVLLMHATCPAHLILFDLIFLFAFGEENKSWSSSLCSFLYETYLFKFSFCMIHLLTVHRIHTRRNFFARVWHQITDHSFGRPYYTVDYTDSCSWNAGGG